MIIQRSCQYSQGRETTRLDLALAGTMGISRGRARRIIALGGAYINGKRVRVQSRAVRIGDQLQAYWAEPPEPEPPPLRRDALLLRDAALLVVNKPAGLYSQPARHRVKGTLPDMLAAMLNLRQLPSPINRLDREASGLILLGMDRPTRSRLSRSWQRAEVEKTYLALLWDQGATLPAHGRLDAPLQPDPEQPGRMRVASRGRGRRALTDFKILQRGQTGVCLAELRPLTGRTHQLRLHCAWAGCPLLGDRLYAPRVVADMVDVLCLHSWRLESPHLPPNLEAPLPGDFKTALASHGLDFDL